MTKVSRYKTLRQEIIDILGGKCCRCGASDIRVLQIDHVNGGGNKERRELGTGVRYLEHILANLDQHQLLCANDNCIKRCENKENYKIKETSYELILVFL